MRFLLVFMFLSATAFAGVPQSTIRDFSVNYLDTAFADANSSILTDLPRKKHFAGKNDTAVDLILCWNVSSESDCSDDYLLKAGDGFAFDDFYLKGDIYARVDGASSVATGKLNLLAW